MYQYIFLFAIFFSYHKTILVAEEIIVFIAGLPIMGKVSGIKTLSPSYLAPHCRLSGLVVFFQDTTIELELPVNLFEDIILIIPITTVVVRRFAIRRTEFLIQSACKLFSRIQDRSFSYT